MQWKILVLVGLVAICVGASERQCNCVRCDDLQSCGCGCGSSGGGGQGLTELEALEGRIRRQVYLGPRVGFRRGDSTRMPRRFGRVQYGTTSDPEADPADESVVGQPGLYVPNNVRRGPFRVIRLLGRGNKFNPVF